MGRRSKLELLDLVERVVSLSVDEKKTIKEIESILRTEGYDVSREAIRRTLKTTAESAQEYKKALDESKLLIDAVKNNPNTDVYETAISLLAGKMLDNVRTIEEINFDDPMKMTDAISKLANSQVKIAKFRLEFQKGYEAAKQEFIDRLGNELEEHPELLAQITLVVSTMEAEV